jgi:hypothetical protein
MPHDPLDIPNFLRRSHTQEHVMKTAEAEHAAKAETTSPQQPAQKCQRVELPAAL